MSTGTTAAHSGLDELLKRPLVQTIWHRRTHRVSRGVPLLKSGSMTYKSMQAPKPLSELEEAVLIAATGHTGLTMPDRPFQDPNSDELIMAKPNLSMEGRTAGSPDNAQGTHFFMINDRGTYFIKRLPYADTATALSPATLIERAQRAKVAVLDRLIFGTVRVAQPQQHARLRDGKNGEGRAGFLPKRFAVRVKEFKGIIGKNGPGLAPGG